jgi:cobalt-zinc-cadmium resistance protein CzcA
MIDVQDTVAIAVGGRDAGVFYQGDRRFNIGVRLPEGIRADVEALRRLPIPLPKGTNAATSYIPLGEVATLSIAPGPNQISRENGKRRIVISANVRGRDLGTFVPEAMAAIDTREDPHRLLDCLGWHVRAVAVGNGTAPNRRARGAADGVRTAVCHVRQCARRVDRLHRDSVCIDRWRPGLVDARYSVVDLRSGRLHCALGVAVLNGLVMLSFIRSLREEGRSLDDAVFNGALTRLRPVLMTALVASLGFVPMAIATGTGAEVQRPLATVVIGGILSSTALTLLVLPVLYRWAHGRLASR